MSNSNIMSREKYEEASALVDRLHGTGKTYGTIVRLVGKEVMKEYHGAMLDYDEEKLWSLLEERREAYLTEEKRQFQTIVGASDDLLFEMMNSKRTFRRTKAEILRKPKLAQKILIAALCDKDEAISCIAVRHPSLSNQSLQDSIGYLIHDSAKLLARIRLGKSKITSSKQIISNVS